MKVTHVIRGDDHIENTFRHVALYRALGAPLPRFAHLPMIVNQHGKPYSKRDGAAYIGDFRAQGYLGEALFNYLALLGWSPGEDREVVSRDELTALFDLKNVKSSAAQMDLAKCEWMNGEYIRALPRETYARMFQDALRDGGVDAAAADPAYLRAVMDLMQVRTHVFKQLPADAGFFFRDDYAYDDKAVRKRLQKPGVVEVLQQLREALAAQTPFDVASLEAAVRAVSERAGAGTGQYFHPLRVAVSGIMHGPGLFELLEVLGRERVVARIERTLRMLETLPAPTGAEPA
jgi:glutamyl/glutaminyl-tRNA synthetase